MTKYLALYFTKTPAPAYQTHSYIRPEATFSVLSFTEKSHPLWYEEFLLLQDLYGSQYIVTHAHVGKYTHRHYYVQDPTTERVSITFLTFENNAVEHTFWTLLGINEILEYGPSNLYDTILLADFLGDNTFTVVNCMTPIHAETVQNTIDIDDPVDDLFDAGTMLGDVEDQGDEPMFLT